MIIVLLPPIEFGPMTIECDVLQIWVYQTLWNRYDRHSDYHHHFDFDSFDCDCDRSYDCHYSERRWGHHHHHHHHSLHPAPSQRRPIYHKSFPITFYVPTPHDL